MVTIKSQPLTPRNNLCVLEERARSTALACPGVRPAYCSRWSTPSSRCSCCSWCNRHSRRSSSICPGPRSLCNSNCCCSARNRGLKILVSFVFGMQLVTLWIYNWNNRCSPCSSCNCCCHLCLYRRPSWIFKVCLFICSEVWQCSTANGGVQRDEMRSV